MSRRRCSCCFVHDDDAPDRCDLQRRIAIIFKWGVTGVARFVAALWVPSAWPSALSAGRAAVARIRRHRSIASSSATVAAKITIF